MEIAEDSSHLFLGMLYMCVCVVYHIYHQRKKQDMFGNKFLTVINSKNQIYGKKYFYILLY